jgi:hypothetical protein
MSKERIPKEDLNMNVKGKSPRQRTRSTRNQQVRKHVTQRKDNGRNLRGSSGKTELAGEALWSNDPLKWKRLRKKKIKVNHKTFCNI